MAKRRKVSITIRVDEGKAQISERLFGLHLEHIWNCVYPCIWVGEGSDAPNREGIREDTVRMLSALRPTVFKYPGGYFTDFYDWRDGVGPRERRPAREYPCVPGRVERNEFGTAEFVRLCRLVGAEPYLAVNTTSIEPSDAAHWVEYCNGTRDTYWANRRREDGYEEPFCVKYWAIGNEAYYLHSADAYAERYRQWVLWMYNADPSITVVAQGIEPGLCEGGLCNPDGSWGRRFLKLTGACNWWRNHWHNAPKEKEVFYAFHPYFYAENACCTPAEYYRAFADLETRLPRSIATIVKRFDETRGQYARPKLCFDEYGLLHSGTRMDGNMTQPALFWSTLWLGCFFQICFEHAETVGMATHPGPINMEHELLLLEEGKVVATPSYHLFKMYRDHGGAQALGIELEGAPRAGAEKLPALRASASVDRKTGTVTLSVINIDLERSVPAEVRLVGAHVKGARGKELFSGDIHARNSAASPRHVEPREVRVKPTAGRIMHEFRPHSVTVLRIKTR
ncbi:MAG: alpha-L-arabinofuranosidase C-terminal domain-containing protein [Planctomycetota bacterium]